MEYLDEWLFLVVLQLFAVASPGPDFVMAVRNSVVFSRKAGIFTAFGFAAGVAVHVAYCMAGLAAVITQSILMFNIIKYIGAAYLIYVGVKALISKGANVDINAPRAAGKQMSNVAAFRSGFITNLFNPKATMYFLAVFTQVVDPATPISVQFGYGITLVMLTAAWFSFVALVLTNPAIKAVFMRFATWIDRACGSLMVALGLKLALTR